MKKRLRLKKKVRNTFLISGLILIFFSFLFSLGKPLMIRIINKIDKTKTNYIPSNNIYSKSDNYSFIKTTSKRKVESYSDLKEIYYTFLNSGGSTGNFTCSSKYKECSEDLKKLINDKDTLSHLNNFVHPYNTFKELDTNFNILGSITVRKTPNYTKEEIDEINKIVKKVDKEIIKDEKSPANIIKLVHDYIINNTVYSSDKSSNKKVNNAYGALIEGIGLCDAYTDAFAIFMNYYKIPNFKVEAENHTWNAVKLNDKWYHIDLTWDDPITGLNDLVIYKYYMIDTPTLLSLDTKEHNFNKEVYKELS